MRKSRKSCTGSRNHRSWTRQLRLCRLVFSLNWFIFIGSMSFPLPRPESSQLPQCLVRNIDCQQKAIRAVRFNGERPSTLPFWLYYTRFYRIVFILFSFFYIFNLYVNWDDAYLWIRFLLSKHSLAVDFDGFVWGKLECLVSCCLLFSFLFFFFNAVKFN